MIFFKITQRKNSLSKEGEMLYYATTVISGKTDFNELCDKVHTFTKIDKRILGEAFTYGWYVMKNDMFHGKAVEMIDKTSVYLQVTSKAKKNKDEVNILDYSKREIIVKPSSSFLKIFEKLRYIEKRE